MVQPGLYALGQPDPETPVFVTANYQLSFDALRSALPGRAAYFLVLDTFGVNVWCAAGKGTFGTDELVRRIESTGLARWVTHRKLILPQLGASGVAAHEVRKRSGFRVLYGPVRAEDLGTYLDAGQTATPAMRQVTFTLAERAVLTPIEIAHWFLPMIAAALVLWLLCGPWGALASPLAILGGVLFFPLLMPWIPTRDFSSKGYLLGALFLLLPAIALLTTGSGLESWAQAVGTMALGASTTAYLALSFTGSTPLTSPSGVQREMNRYIPSMAVLAGLGVLLLLGQALVRWIGG